MSLMDVFEGMTQEKFDTMRKIVDKHFPDDGPTAEEVVLLPAEEIQKRQDALTKDMEAAGITKDQMTMFSIYSCARTNLNFLYQDLTEKGLISGDGSDDDVKLVRKAFTFLAREVVDGAWMLSKEEKEDTYTLLNVYADTITGVKDKED